MKNTRIPAQTAEAINEMNSIILDLIQVDERFLHYREKYNSLIPTHIRIVIEEYIVDSMNICYDLQAEFLRAVVKNTCSNGK